MVLYDIDPLDKKLEFNGNADIIILKGSAVIESNGTSILYEAPRLVSSPCFGTESSFFIEFSTDAKYMCNPLNCEKGFWSGKNLEDKSSFVNLELKPTRLTENSLPSRNMHRRYSSFGMDEGQMHLLMTHLRQKPEAGAIRRDDAHLEDDLHLV